MRRNWKFYLPGEKAGGEEPRTEWAELPNLQALISSVQNHPKIKGLGEVDILLRDGDGDYLNIRSEDASLPSGVPLLDIRHWYTFYPVAES